MNRPGRTKKRLLRAAQNAALVFASVLFALVCIELGVRLVGVSYHNVVLNQAMMLDPVCGFRLKPNAKLALAPGVFPEVKINTFGHRDQEYPKQNDHSLRILALGDSFAYGRVAYEYNFLTLLEERLDEAFADETIEILNSGVPAYQPVNEFAYLKAYGFRFEPDAVIFCLYVGNDLRNNDLAPTDIHPETPVSDLKTAAPVISFEYWLSHSEVYWMVRNILMRRAMMGEIESRLPEFSSRALDEPNRIEPDFWMMSEDQYKHNIENQMRSYILPQFWSDWDRKNIEATIAVTLKMNEACKEKGIDFAVVLVPSEVQVDDDVSQVLYEVIEGKIDRNAISLMEPQAALFTRLAQQGVNVIDLLPAFQEKGKDQRLYLLRDTHWNEDGNALAAEVLFEPLEAWAAAKLAQDN
ncbi:MAG: hypothetical protein P9L94_17670 [Candidatus Hinthialibacter antarcticus]|nr:hypothetical protein [Candidatus Hinthialibacter antarcticus]